MTAQCFFATTPAELGERLAAYAQQGYRPTLALMFCSMTLDHAAFIPVFKQRGIDLAGCTASGEISDGVLSEEKCAVLLMDLPKDSFRVFRCEAEDRDYKPVGRKLGAWAAAAFEHPAMLLYTGGVGVNGESAMRGLQEVIGPTAPIYGGMGSDGLRFDRIAVFDHEGSSDLGAVAIALDQKKVAVTGLAYSGWDELGMTHTITKAKENIIYEIDGQKALDLFENYFPSLRFESSTPEDELFTIPGVYPLKIQQGDSKRGFLRSIALYDRENQSLIMSGEVEEGAKFKFCPMPGLEVVDATIGRFNDIAGRSGKVEAIIINSCFGRHRAFGPMFHDELQGLQQAWDCPSIGYLSYGEFGNMGEGSACAFHNLTCALVALTEKNAEG